jgi:hypothetical protein
MGCAADRGEPEHARTAGRDRVSAQQGDTVVQQSIFEPGDETGIVRAQHVSGQYAKRFRALSRKVAHVHRDELPGHVCGVLSGQEMDPFHHHVVSEDQRFLADLQHRAIVGQPASSRMRRQLAQHADIERLVRHRTVICPGQ